MTTAEQCLEELRGRAPFFLWVDTWDPHEPWDAPPWYVEPYKPDYDGRVVWPPYRAYTDAGMSDDDLATAVACYRGKLTMVDRWIGRLVDRIDTLNLADDTVVVFLSDHGFYLGERGGLLGKLIRHVDESGTARWRRSPLYHEIVDIPLWIRDPRVAGRLDDRLVSAIDLAPTLLEFFGLDVPPSFHGRSLLSSGRVRDVAVTALPLADPGTPSPVVDDVFRVIDDWQPITVTTDEWRLLFSRWADPVELYDIANDPAETRNLADANPDVVKRLHALMIDELARADARADDLQPRR
jgi:arylsulfatase A-like enzyme